MDILEKILATKRQEVATLKNTFSIRNLEDKIAAQQPTRGFAHALLNNNPAIIAEVKKASPSKGIIRESFDPVAIAKSYQQYGATCLSILTDQNYFKGHNDYLSAIRKAVTLPLLRKDFIIDPHQVFEARAIGADCILLIVAALSSQQLQELASVAEQLQLDILVEVHNNQELQQALELNTQLIGVNNRDLHTFNTNINTTIDLLNNMPDDKLVISESGIHSASDVEHLIKHGIKAFLIGEAFMRLEEPGIGLQALFAQHGNV